MFTFHYYPAYLLNYSPISAPMPDRAEIEKNDFIDESVKDVTLHFDLSLSTARRLEDRVGSIEVLVHEFGSNGPDDYLDLIRRRESLPVQKSERLDELARGLRRWCAEKTDGLYVVHDSEIDDFYSEYGYSTQSTGIDSEHSAVVTKLQDNSDNDTDNFGVNWAEEIEDYREEAESKENWVIYELRRLDPKWLEFARELWQIEQKLIDIYQVFLENEPDQFQYKKEKVIRLKEAFPYLRVMNDLVARAAGCSVSYAAQFQEIGDEGVTKKKSSSTLRETVLDRDNEGCVSCEGTDDLNVHHIVPRGQGGANEPENLATLCKQCHYYAHGGGIPTDNGYRAANYESVDYADADGFWEEWIDLDFSKRARKGFTRVE